MARRAYCPPVRRITIAILVLLLAATAVSGSQARAHATTTAQKAHATKTAQKAIEAPRPSGVAKTKGGFVQQIACASAKSCAAIGEWLYTEQAGKWKAVKVPPLAHAGPANLRSLVCSVAGGCEGVGMVGLHHVVHVRQSGRQWTLGEVALPPAAKPVDPPSGPAPTLPSISCVSAGNCVAVGGYDASDRTTHPLLVTESGRTWGAGMDAQLPPNAATSPDLDFPGAGGSLSLVACPAAGDCAAVGTYVNADASYSYYPWLANESGGTWTPGVEASLPADASIRGDLTNGPSPFFGFTGLSCPSVGNCTAVGGYENEQGSEEGLILRESNGVWLRGIRAPLPPKGVPNTEPNEFTNPMTSISCSAPGDCAAVGLYVTHGSGTFRGLLLRERAGTWKASALVLPAGAKAPGGVFLTSVACASRGNCVAVGYYGNRGKTRGLVVRERVGRWGRAVNAALPKGAAPARKQHAFLNSVSCPSATACAAGGYYADRSGHTQGLLLSLRLR